MDTLLPVLEAKLKRHGLKFSYDDKRKVLTLGGATLSASIILGYIILPAVLLVLIIVGINSIFTFESSTVMLVSNLSVIGSVFLLVFIAVRAIMRKAGQNKKTKTFYPDRLVIMDEKKKNEIPVADIAGFKKDIFDNDDSLIRGELFLLTKTNDYLILSIIDENVRYVKGDLDFFENYFCKIWHSEGEKKEMVSLETIFYEESDGSNLFDR